MANEEKKTERVESKNKKKPLGFFGRIAKWFRELRSELKKVVWPTGKQVVNNVLWVIGLVVVVAAIVLLVDLVLKTADTKLWELITKWIG